MPRSAIVSVGISWGRPGTRTCGISVGYAGGFRRLTQPAVVNGVQLPEADSRPGPRGQPGLAGLPYPADPRVTDPGLSAGQVPAEPSADAGASRGGRDAPGEKGAGTVRVSSSGGQPLRADVRARA